MFELGCFDFHFPQGKGNRIYRTEMGHPGKILVFSLPFGRLDKKYIFDLGIASSEVQDEVCKDHV